MAEILSREFSQKTGTHIVVVFGMGMIGSAIRDNLLRMGFNTELTIPYDWQQASSRLKALEFVGSEIRKHASNYVRVSLLWSAGSINFHSSDGEVEKESESLVEIIDWADSNFVGNLRYKIDFHFISSAGGLFEGQRRVSLASRPLPLRPYGRCKLSQENLLEKHFHTDQLAVYRPSSVYGPMMCKSRQGLINNLIHNGQKRRVTILDSQVMSLRDYVFSGDIGQFVAKKIFTGGIGCHFLVNSRSSSIFEVTRKIERTLKIRLNVKYDDFFGNHMNITFSEKILPDNWSPVSLEVGIRQFMVNNK